MMARGTSRAAVVAPLLLLASTQATAEVVESDERGFVIQHSVFAPAAPGHVWAALVDPARWWNPEHSWSGDSTNLTLAPVAGGCFCEALPGDGSVEHMRVIHSSPGQLLRMTGALGPLQAEALTGTLTIELAPEVEGTRITWTYLVGGYARFSLSGVAPSVDAVLSEQLARLETLLQRDEAPAAVF